MSSTARFHDFGIELLFFAGIRDTCHLFVKKVVDPSRIGSFFVGSLRKAKTEVAPILRVGQELQDWQKEQFQLWQSQ